ncbi:MAG: hypothetical protein FWD53_00130 [Phycisphaerales bacterium]|nr:hypothetical protein [Phycisphaerales bacterium]
MFGRTVLLGLVIGIIASLWGCGVGGPIKVSLVTTALSADTRYIMFKMYYTEDDVKEAKDFCLHEESPTATFTLGGIECVVKLQMPGKRDESKSFVPSKLLLKTPTQEFAYSFSERYSYPSMELALDSGRKYFLQDMGYDYLDEPEKIVSRCEFEPAGVQTGKIGTPPFQTPIHLYDANVDGFYTGDKDGIIIGPLTAVPYGPLKLHYVQPLSKYITTPGGIFEILNIARDGSEITLLPYRGPTAKLQVVAPKNYSGQITLTSADANLNVTVCGKAGEWVTVIPGSYTIQNALLNTTSTERYGMYVNQYEHEMPAMKVEAGAEYMLVLSGPRTLECRAAMVDGKINVDVPTVKGEAGERYSYVFDREKPTMVYLNVDDQSTLLGQMEYG